MAAATAACRGREERGRMPGEEGGGAHGAGSPPLLPCHGTTQAHETPPAHTLTVMAAVSSRESPPLAPYAVTSYTGAVEVVGSAAPSL